MKPSTESCIVPLQFSEVLAVTFLGSMDLLNVIEIVLVTALLVLPSAGEIFVTVGTVVSADATVDSSLLPGLEQENANTRKASNTKYLRLEMLNLFTKNHPINGIQKVTPMPSCT